MASLGLRHSTEMQTRDRYTKVNFELGMKVEGRELPNASVLGSALEEAVKLIEQRVKESYEVIPPRPDVNAPVNSGDPSFLKS